MGDFMIALASLLLAAELIWRGLLRFDATSEPVPAPLPPAFTIRPAPPYDWSEHGD